MNRLIAVLLKLESIIAVTAYVVTAAVLTADIIGRELFNYPIWGAHKLAVFGAIIAAVLGLTVAVSNNAHLRANVADKLLPFAWADMVGDLLSAVLFAFLAWYAWQWLGESITYKDKVEVLNIPLWPFQLVIPYAFASSAVKHLAFALGLVYKPQPGGAM